MVKANNLYFPLYYSKHSGLEILYAFCVNGWWYFVGLEGIPHERFFEILVRRKMLGGLVRFCARGLMVKVFCF